MAFFQVTIFISFFLAVRNLAQLPVPGFSTGGIGWFTDLTMADPFYILPICSSLGMLLGFEVLLLFI
jgi:YidC/Oxa1 family membrane protein insertase